MIISLGVTSKDGGYIYSAPFSRRTMSRGPGIYQHTYKLVLVEGIIRATINPINILTTVQMTNNLH